jgi:hypothetical protein
MCQMCVEICVVRCVRQRQMALPSGSLQHEVWPIAKFLTACVPITAHLFSSGTDLCNMVSGAQGEPLFCLFPVAGDHHNLARRGDSSARLSDFRIA